MEAQKWFNGLMVYWFNGLMGFPLGKTKPFLESLVQRLRNTGGGGGGYPPAHIYIYIYMPIFPTRPHCVTCTAKNQQIHGRPEIHCETVRQVVATQADQSWNLDYTHGIGLGFSGLRVLGYRI